MALRRAGKGYVLGVNANHPFRSWAKTQAIAGTAREIADSLPEAAWRRLSAGDGTKGERLHDWVSLELADLEASEYNPALTGVWTRGLLIRRKITGGDLAYFSTWSPAGTPIETLVKVEGHRWAIEDSFETAKNELGLDHNETRSWHGWHRHVSPHSPGHTERPWRDGGVNEPDGRRSAGDSHATRRGRSGSVTRLGFFRSGQSSHPRRCNLDQGQTLGRPCLLETSKRSRPVVDNLENYPSRHARPNFSGGVDDASSKLGSTAGVGSSPTVICGGAGGPLSL